MENRLANSQLGDAARVPGSTIPISTVLHLTSEGLVLGAGTLLVAAHAARRLSSLRGQEARVLALLSAAYNRAVPPSVLGNIERAAKSWRDGAVSLAYIHLAHARLPELQKPHTAAQRLFLADELMKAGGKPRTIFEILDLDAAFIDALEKRYNPAEPRVPVGSGRISGEWTRLLLGLAISQPRRQNSTCSRRASAVGRQYSGCYSSHLQTDSELKVRCQACPGCTTPGIAMRHCFTLRMTALTVGGAPSPRSWRTTCSAIRIAGSSAACFPEAASPSTGPRSR